MCDQCSETNDELPYPCGCLMVLVILAVLAIGFYLSVTGEMT